MKRNIHYLSMVAAILFLLIIVVEPADSRRRFGENSSGTIYLVGGRQKVLKIKGIQKVAIGNPSVADVKPLGTNQVLVTGVGVGKTTLIIWKKSGEQESFYIKVSARDPKSLQAEISKMLGDREGISIRLVGEKVVMDGHALTTEDYLRSREIAKIYNQVVSFVKLSSDAKRVVAEQLNNILHQAGLINVVATVYGTKIFLEGTVSSKDELKRAELITTAMGEKVENLLKIGEKLLVAIEVNFVEVKRSSLDKIGVKLLPNVAGDGSIGFTMVESLVGAGSQNQQNLDITAGAAGKIGLDMIFNKGYARILSRPKLVCASGGKAKFHAGGEVPIPMITGNSATVEYKEFGVILNVVPTADHMGNITVKIEVEVSDVDRSLAVTASVGTFHGFSITKGETIMTLKHGETIIISGLFNNTEQKDVGKFPGLGHIPILGEFFKSREFAAKKSELAIFVTPRIVSPKSEYLETTLDNIKKRYKKADEEVHFSIFD